MTWTVAWTGTDHSVEEIAGHSAGKPGFTQVNTSPVLLVGVAFEKKAQQQSEPANITCYDTGCRRRSAHSSVCQYLKF